MVRKAGIHEFFPARYPMKLDKAEGIPGIFEVVKEAVQDMEGVTRAGLLLGIAELDDGPDRFIAALHPLGSNIILLNRFPLDRVKEQRPELYKAYVFHVLLTEYLHTVGLVEEEQVVPRAMAITRPLFGEEHLATKLAEDISQVLPFVRYPVRMRLPEGTKIELVAGFDRSSATGHIG